MRSADVSLLVSIIIIAPHIPASFAWLPAMFFFVASIIAEAKEKRGSDDA